MVEYYSRFSSGISVFSCHCRFCIAFSCFLVSGLLVASFLETLVGLVTNVPFVFGKASPLTKTTLGHSSRLRRAGHAATGDYSAALPEQMRSCPSSCRTGTPYTTHFSLMFTRQRCLSLVVMTKMMTYALCISLQLIQVS